MYQQIRLSDFAAIGAPGPLPYVIANWTREDVAELVPMADDAKAQLGLTGIGFWPVTTTTPAYDPLSQVVVPPASYTPDPASKTVTGTATIRAMTSEEYAAANPVPDSVTNYQARAALVAAGKFAAVDAALRGADQSIEANQLALQAWDYANSFYRTSPFVASFGPALGLTDAQIDDLFRAAAKVV